MTKIEKLNKIVEMSKEMILLQGDNFSDDEVDKLYIQTKLALETYKELYEDEKEDDSDD